MSDAALAILHPLTRREVDDIIAIGEALARIDAKLSTLMGETGAGVAKHARALAADLIDLFDKADGDPDLEDGGDDEDSDPAEDNADGEPSLGAAPCDSRRIMYGYEPRPDPTSSQVCWAEGVRSGPLLDAEGDEHDGAEPDEDGEPSLCGLTVGPGGDMDLEGEHDGREPEDAI